MRELALLLILLVFTALVCGCTTTPAPAQTAAPTSLQTVQSAAPVASGPTQVVHITATTFDRYDTYIKTGMTVTWINEDKMPRHVVHLPTGATDRELFNSGSLSPGDTFSYTFTQPGRYVYGDPQHGGGRSPFVNVSD